jgi:hypothetical protein
MLLSEAIELARRNNPDFRRRRTMSG